jgi:hypothetical protein
MNTVFENIKTGKRFAIFNASNLGNILWRAI